MRKCPKCGWESDREFLSCPQCGFMDGNQPMSFNTNNMQFPQQGFNGGYYQQQQFPTAAPMEYSQESKTPPVEIDGKNKKMDKCVIYKFAWIPVAFIWLLTIVFMFIKNAKDYYPDNFWTAIVCGPIIVLFFLLLGEICSAMIKSQETKGSDR